jgi:hypothetical protein
VSRDGASRGINEAIFLPLVLPICNFQRPGPLDLPTDDPLLVRPVAYQGAYLNPPGDGHAKRSLKYGREGGEWACWTSRYEAGAEVARLVSERDHQPGHHRQHTDDDELCGDDETEGTEHKARVRAKVKDAGRPG